MLYTVTHRTEYKYDSRVSLSQHVLHLRPRVTQRQQVYDFQLRVEPPMEAGFLHDDYFGNHVDVVSLDTPYSLLAITSVSRLGVVSPAWPDPEFTPPWEEARGAAMTELADGCPIEFLYDSDRVRAAAVFRDYALKVFSARRPFLAALNELVHRIYRDFRFDPEATKTTTPIEEAFRLRRGVCQDFAHIGIACLRSIGLPARYVSGYLETVPPRGQPRLAGADASHAWLAAWCPGLGWVDADPTNDLLPGDRHVTVGWGRDFGDVSPIRGVAIGGGEHKLKVGVDVLRDGAG